MAALNIPIKVNLDDFKKKMNETSSLAKTAARKAAQQFLEMNKEIAAAAGAEAFNTAGLAALKLAGRVALVVGAAKLMGDAIGAARDQLKDMVDLANKAQNLGVSSSFFQKFSAEAKKLQVDASDLEGALQHAFDATRDKAPVDLSAWDTGKDRITEVERALRIYNETIAKAAGQQLQGLVLFRDADSQEAKIQAVLKAMIQLDQIGQHAAALDVGEKMFGSQFVERIRQGRTSAESMLATIQKASGDADGIFSDTLVRRAKEVDDQLNVAHQRLSTALKPSWDDLASVMATIKGYWASTVDLIAQAAEISNKIKIPGFSPSSLQDKKDAIAAIDKRLAGEDSGGIVNSAYDAVSKYIPGLANFTRDQLKQRRYELQGEIANDENAFQGPNLPAKPSRGTGDKPTLKPTGGSDTDKLESSAESIEKRTAALNAEAQAYDLGTAAREKARIEAQLMAVAVQANTAAGKADTAATAEQKARIAEVADAYSKAAEAIQKAKVASDIKFGQQTALLDPQDVQIAQQLKGLYPDVATALGSVEANAMRTNEALRGMSSTISSGLTTGLADILDGTKSVSQGFADMGKMIVRALEEAMIKMLIVAPIMRSLQGLGGGLLGALGIGGAASAVPYGAITLGGPAGPVPFDRGGYTGPGGVHEPRGVVHAGEVVWSQEDVARSGGVGVVEAMRRGLRGYLDGGPVAYPGGGIVTADNLPAGVKVNL